MHPAKSFRETDPERLTALVADVGLALIVGIADGRPLVAHAPVLLQGQRLRFHLSRANPLAAALDMWETTFLHILTGENAVTEWAAGSSLRPFLDKLPPALKQPFRDAYSEALRPHYPRRADGTTLLPFKRLFMVARVGV